MGDVDETDMVVEELRAELKALKTSSRASLEEAHAETAKKVLLLEEAESKVRVLTEALTQASETVATLRQKQTGLVITVREATAKAKAMEAYAAHEEELRVAATKKTDEMREELRHVQWKLSQAAATEADLRSSLYDEQMARQQAEEAKPAETDVSNELRARANGAVAAAAVATAAATDLSHRSLKEAAMARAERSRLEERCRKLEAAARAAGMCVHPMTFQSCGSSAPPTPTGGTRLASRKGQVPPGALPASLPAVPVGFSDRDMSVAVLHAHLFGLSQPADAHAHAISLSQARGRPLGQRRASTPLSKRRPPGVMPAVTPANTPTLRPSSSAHGSVTSGSLRPSSSTSSIRPTPTQGFII